MANVRIGQWFSDFWRGTPPHLHHSTLDTDCLLAALAAEAQRSTDAGRAIAAELAALGVDPAAVASAADAVRPAGGPRHRNPQLTARIEQVAQRARDDAIRMAADVDEPVEMGPIHLFHAVLMHDKGPGAEALRAVGVDPRHARTALGLPEPEPVHILPALWPPPRYTREFVEPREISEAVPDGRQLPRPALPHAPDPSPEAEPSAFVWTSEGQQLEMWSAPGGPIHLRISPGGTLEVSAEAAELVCRMLTGFSHQLQAERWEPIYESERLGRPKPPLPPDPA